MEQGEVLTAFGIRLRSLRLERGLSQERLGELAGLDRTYVSQAEAGRRNVTLMTIHKFAKALGVRPDELLQGEELRPDVANAE